MRPSPLTMVLVSIASVQIGAAFAKTQFDEVSPTGMAWLRLLFAAILLSFFKPSFRGLTRKEWAVGLGLACCLAGMNWTIYEAFSRLPLGLTITIEFLGPLVVALVASRKLLDVVWVALAGLGVALLGVGPTHLDPVGLMFVILAAAGWAGYIVFGSQLSPNFRGTSVIWLSALLGLVLLAGPAFTTSGTAMFRPGVLLVGLAVGILSSVLPYSLDLRALKVMPRRVFGVLQSLGPVAAALAGLVILRETLGLVEWLAVACIVAASIGVTWHKRRPAAAISDDGPARSGD